MICPLAWRPDTKSQPLSFCFWRDTVWRLVSTTLSFQIGWQWLLMATNQSRRQEMNKAELASDVGGKVGITKKKAQNVVDAMTEIIGDTLSRGENVTLVGFGTFQVATRKARRGVNPQTKETIQTPARKVPKFVPGKSLREKAS